MHRNQFLTLIFLLFIGVNTYSQEIRVSREMPESENQLIGSWKSKIISGRGMDLTIVDTASDNVQRRVVKVAPEIERVKKVENISCFMHNQFLYEIYYVMPTLKDMASLTGYNLIVKRDIETMKIVTQKK